VSSGRDGPGPGGGRSLGPGGGRGRGLVLGAALGDCVHVAGLLHFLSIAEAEGWQTRFLGPAQPVSAIVAAIERLRPDMVGLSYRLGAETAGPYFAEMVQAARERDFGKVAFVFGGTAPICRIAEESGLFFRVFSSAATEDDVRAVVSGAAASTGSSATPLSGQALGGGLVERVAGAHPKPIYRHHFGLASLEATVEGCATLAESGLVDVISIGPDQNTQERFFHPEAMDESRAGAGGVPLRRREDFIRLRQACRRGNYPLLRCYSGTQDVLDMARLLRETLDNAWCAIPLFWYSVLDARSDRPLRQSLRQNMEVVAWHAERGVPVEVNEAHQWSLREAPDTVAVATAFLAAYNARARGVRHYVSQYMFNTPLGTKPEMDLGKMLAKIDLIEALQGESFSTLRQVRTGLASLPTDPAEAKGHLAASTYVQMAVRPHIVHVVAYCEADHAATPEEIIESLKICHRVAAMASEAPLAPEASPAVEERRKELRAEATELLEAIRELAEPGVADPWTDPETLVRAVEIGLLDCPHLAGNPVARGEVRTRIIDGRCLAVDPETGRAVSEKNRIKRVFARSA